ncbi:hypothetical protein FIBSPDRAFT_814728 [Athelia psychrophila]|uniref:BTB domain-containing protein n=1 Tax=Athelia psychrophila TaxID=1759441 RepID=A0A166TC18_9AGAM|nr:hypothetical protein FIBSPDRAFT_814728 [Fibularhizoctonia sp. CBS 109695]
MSTSDRLPTLKRKRAEDESLREGSTTPAPLVRSDIWYDDGNVVLQAGCTQFKLYRGILGENSSVFKDMVSFPQPPLVDTDLVDGCPVVHLSDSAEDVKYVLQSICQRKYMSFGEKLSLAVLSAFIRLGRKYDIRDLYIEALKRLYIQFPILEGELVIEWTVVQEPASLFELITFARTTGMLSILPDVLYTCCQKYSASEIIGGINGTDGSISSLRTEDQLTCLAGHRAICKSQLQTTYSWIYGNLAPGCITGAHCRVARRKFLLAHFTLLAPSPIGGLDLWGHRKFPTLQMCQFCIEYAKKKHANGRVEFYGLLPGLFDLPPWVELLKEREELNKIAFRPCCIHTQGCGSQAGATNPNRSISTNSAWTKLCELITFRAFT